MHYWSNVLRILRGIVGAEVIVTSVPGFVSLLFWVYSVARCQTRRTTAITSQRTWYQLPCSLNGRSRLQASNIPHQTCRICSFVFNMYQYTPSRKSFHGLVCGESFPHAVSPSKFISHRHQSNRLILVLEN
jgi:hypothetical protein